MESAIKWRALRIRLHLRRPHHSRLPSPFTQARPTNRHSGLMTPKITRKAHEAPQGVSFVQEGFEGNESRRLSTNTFKTRTIDGLIVSACENLTLNQRMHVSQLSKLKTLTSWSIEDLDNYETSLKKVALLPLSGFESWDVRSSRFSSDFGSNIFFKMWNTPTQKLSKLNDPTQTGVSRRVSSSGKFANGAEMTLPSFESC